MHVKVLLFGQLREIVGASEEEVAIESGACAADLLADYQRRFPGMEEFRPSIAMAINQEYADGSAPLRDGDEVALLPPVSGGEHARLEIIELAHESIDTAALAAQVKTPRDGAVVTFDGIVRNETGGRETLYLEYEAYEPMALGKMREIAGEMRERFDVDGLVLVHRLGRLEIGETSVFLAVSSAHRAAAFDACRYAIETLKRTAPIWKKEYGAGGAVWVEGRTPGPAIEDRPAEKEA